MVRSLIALLLATAPICFAQSGIAEPSPARAAAPEPFSLLLDLEPLRTKPDAEQANYPIWLDSVELPPASANGENVVRLRLRDLPELSDQLLLRLFFFDRVGESEGLRVTGWTETGREVYHAGPIGLGMGLPASEALAISTQGIDYLEITVPNDPQGRVLRQILLATLTREESLTALDFAGIPSLADPFTREAEALDDLAPLPEESDTFLFGRTRATLHHAPVKLSPGSEGTATVHFTFHLSAAPLLAMATFSLHHTDPTAPLQAWINGEPVGSVAMQLPDLADPGYLAAPQRFSATRFRYAGWLRGQIAFPGRHLRVGANTLSLQLPEEAAPVVLHRLELQLKSHWHKLDYTLQSP